MAAKGAVGQEKKMTLHTGRRALGGITQTMYAKPGHASRLTANMGYLQKTQLVEDRLPS